MTDSLLASATTAELRGIVERLGKAECARRHDMAWGNLELTSEDLRLAAAALSLIAEGRERATFESAADVMQHDLPHHNRSIEILRQLAGTE